jgi:tryptophan 7-halogenase
MSRARIASIAILGGGSAGWLTAATLARLLKPDFCELRLIDSPRCPPAAISDSALPSFHRLNNLLGINEQDLMQRTGATFKLGSQFIDWDRIGQAYFHTFGPFGAKLEAVPFHQHWLRLSRAGHGGKLEDYSTAAVACRHGRFARPATDRQSVLSQYSYGYHFHAASLAAYLRNYAQAHGVSRIERSILETRLRGEDGFVDELLLDDGTSIRADLYIDCRDASQVAARPLVEGARVDWSDWLPCDRAVALPCSSTGELAPYSQAAAQPYGWLWHIPLQQCIDAGYAYSSQYLSDDQATAALLEQLPGDALAEPRLLRLLCGAPARFWERNWLRLPGNSLEPLESTGLHLVQTGITRLISLFPVHRYSPDDVEEYNRLTAMEYERIRDFLILHYKATARRDSPFWDYCRQMQIPDSLRAKIELFKDSGRIAMLEDEHFGEDSWLSVLLGQGIEPSGYDPLADVLGIEEAGAALGYLRSKIAAAVATLPRHGQFVAEHCRAIAPGAL